MDEIIKTEKESHYDLSLNLELRIRKHQFLVINI